MSEIIAPLHVLTECDVTSNVFGVGRRTVWKQVQESTENQIVLTQLSHENLKKFVIKFIYKDKVSTTLTEMRAQKWKNLKNRKAQTFARIVPAVDSNFHRNERVTYYANVLLNVQNPAYHQHGLQIMVIKFWMDYVCQQCNQKLFYLMSWWNKLITTFRWTIQALQTTMTIVLLMKMNLMLNCLSESNSTKHLLTVYLFKMKNIFYHACFNFVLKLEAAQKFLVLLVLFKKLLAYILKKKKGKNYDQSQKKFESYLKNCARHCS